MAEKLPKYLTRRKDGWLWVQIAVPEKAKKIIKKTILRKYLSTKDAAVAQIEMGQYITQFKRMISAAKVGRALPHTDPKAATIDPISKKALEIRRQGYHNEDAIELIASSLPLQQSYALIYSPLKMPGVAEAMQHFDFVDTAMGRKTPILAFLDDFISNYKGRAEHTVETRRKDVLKLANWLRDKDKLETVEQITRPVAVQFKR
ncbi:MAG: hypothetical protein IT541_15820, partial [Hyphomicrobiales bacterium]|nr:hypothetical protein [Hyphomicrobiales bacterium]